MSKIKKIILFLIALKNLLKKNSKRQFSLDFKTMIFSWKRGFLPESYIIYNFKNNSPLNYLSDLSRATKTNSINKENSIIIDNKLLFAINFKEDKIVLPLFYINNNSALDLKKNENISIKDLIQFLKKGSEFVIKPEGGGGGYGIYFIKYSDSDWYMNGDKLKESYIFNFLSKLSRNLLYDKIEQTGIASKVFPKSLNTLRLLTMVDPNSKDAFISYAVFRCGTSKTDGVDNWSNGGLSAKIDIESGIVGKAVGFPNLGKLQWEEFHPDTGYKIEGMKLPNWEIIKEEILHLSEKHFYIPYIGWDIVCMENDYMILEANSNSDVNLLQVHGPLIVNDNVKSFYEYYKVI